MRNSLFYFSYFKCNLITYVSFFFNCLKGGTGDRMGVRACVRVCVRTDDVTDRQEER